MTHLSKSLLRHITSQWVTTDPRNSIDVIFVRNMNTRRRLTLKGTLDLALTPLLLNHLEKIKR